MKTRTRTLWLAAGVLAAASLPSAAQQRGEISREGDTYVERIDRTVDAAAGGTLTVETVKGAIEVTTWERDAVRVRVEKRAEVFTEAEAQRVLEDMEVHLTARGDTIHVLVESATDRANRALGPVGLRLWFTVPGLYSVDLSTRGGPIDVAALQGHVKANTAGGGITVGRVTGGSVTAQTAGGSIRVEEIRGGGGNLQTSGGSIEVGDVPDGDLHAETLGGSIAVGRVGGKLTAETAGGSIRIEGGGARVNAETAGGSIEVGDCAGDVTLATAGGSIEVGNAAGTVGAHTQGGSIRIAGAGPLVEAETLGGSIHVRAARGAVEAKTSGGDVSVWLAPADEDADTHCALESRGGDLELRIPADMKATIDAEIRRAKTLFRDYRITSDFPLDITEEEGDGGTIRGTGTINGGGDLLHLRTTEGDIEIRRH